MNSCNTLESYLCVAFIFGEQLETNKFNESGGQDLRSLGLKVSHSH